MYNVLVSCFQYVNMLMDVHVLYSVVWCNTLKLEIKSIRIIFCLGVYYWMSTYQQQIKQHIDISFATFIQITTWVYIQFKYTKT